MTSHGRLFDQFSAQASHAHGGSYFDESFGHRTLSEAHGKLYDLFGVAREQTAHGERWDEFDWRDMPAIHGQHFDSDFQSPAMGDSEHGSTWFDVFRGGRTQARYMFDGRDYEGVVQEVKREYAVVRSRDGQTHEVGLSQFLAYRTPNEQQAGPTVPESDAEAPSARDHTAHGAMHHGDRAPVSTEIPSPIAHVTPGEHHDADRGDLPAGLMDTFQTVKSLAEREFGDEDVAKAQQHHVGYLAGDKVLCKNCGGGNLPKIHADHKRAQSMGCSHCYDSLGNAVLAKSVDATETAAQGQPTAKKTVGHRSNCPRGGSAPCGADVDGSCSMCGAKVRDHEAIGKASTGDLGIKVPERDHKSTDHHSSQSQPGRCPHCGGALDAVAEATSHGQPSRKEKEGAAAEFDTVTCKCMGATLEVLKTLAGVEQV